MARLGKKYESVCSEDGKENLNQPYIWLGIQDKEGNGTWTGREPNPRTGALEPVRFQNWDENEGSEGDTCARMQGNGNKTMRRNIFTEIIPFTT